MRKIDDRIAREICGWIETYSGFSLRSLCYWRKVGSEMVERYKDNWSPSTNPTDAIEALECLPNGLMWLLEKCENVRYCRIWKLPLGNPPLVTTEDFSSRPLCVAICRALLDKHVLAAVKKARRGAK